MGALLRVLNVVFWVAATLFVASLFLSDFAAGLFGDRGSRVVNAALLVAIVGCSGAITSYEFGRNPIADTERGEWTFDNTRVPIEDVRVCDGTGQIGEQTPLLGR